MSPAESSLHAGHGSAPIAFLADPYLVSCLRGVAASRGEQWKPRTRAEALRCLADLGELVADELVEECLRWASKG